MLSRISKRTPLSVTALDIDADEELQRRYFLEIPVVVVEGIEVARAPISERALAGALAALAGNLQGTG